MGPRIDFHVHSTPYHLSIYDYSEWELIEDKPSIVEITLPGHRKALTKWFDKKKVNVYNSILLELNCFDECTDPEITTLPDGIYTIKVIGSPSTFYHEKKYLKTDLLLMELDKIYIENPHQNDNESFLNQLAQIEFFLRSASAHLKYENVKMASEFFTQASDLVDRLKNCKECHGMWMRK